MSFEVIAQISILDYIQPGFFPRMATGARPVIRYEGMVGASCILDLGIKGEAFVGETIEVTISFLNPELHRELMHVGLEFGLYSANIKLANGKIDALLG